jgi:hypothetical protein
LSLHSKSVVFEIEFLAKAIDLDGALRLQPPAFQRLTHNEDGTMGQQLRQRNKQRRRVLRKKRIKARHAAAKK